MAAGGKVIGAMEGLDAQALLQLLGIYEAALAELRAMNDPGVEPLMRRLERNRAEALAALAALWFPEGQTPWAGLRACGALVSPGIKEIE